MTDYLEALDLLLADGLERVGRPFLQRQAASVRSRQQPDGGFAGRQGASDLYYTDFAVRVLALTGAPDDGFRTVGDYLRRVRVPVDDVVARFNLHNLHRLLAPRGIDVSPSGGPLPTSAGAYQTFLAMLCAGTGDAAMLLALQCADGGFAECAGESCGQANATAAAIAALTMLDALPSAVAARASAFLAGLQAPDGGLRAFARAPQGDLLSTFTGLLTLIGLDAHAALDLPALARFLKRVALPTGGFLACPVDDAPDVEYTYYGLAVLALLNAG